MEQINVICGKVSTIYSPNIEIESFLYVDDVANGGDKKTTEQAMEKVKMLEEKKRTVVNQVKSNYMLINENKKSNDEDEIQLTFNDGNRVEKTEKYKYLGTWLASNGKCDINIEEKRKAYEKVYPKIIMMGAEKRVGNLSTSLKIEQYKIIIRRILLYNLEAWSSLTKENLCHLEKIQAEFLKRILNLPKTTSYFGILFEVGIWRVEEMILFQKLMLLHNIMKSSPERLIRKMICEQEENEYPNSWLQTLRSEAEKRSINVNLEEIQNQSKESYKKFIKKSIEEYMVNEIKRLAGTKMRTVVKAGFGKKEYITDGNLCPEEVQQLIKIRLHMENMKCNFKSANKCSKCQFCQEEEETTEHILFSCGSLSYLRDDLILQGSCLKP